MKFAVGLLVAAVVVVVLFHLHHGAQDRIDGAVRGHPGGDRAHLRFDQAPHGQHFERPRPHFGQVGRQLGAVGHVDAGTAAHFDDAAQFERDQRFAQRGAADAETRGKVAFRGQALAAADVLFPDQLFDAVRHHAVQAGLGSERLWGCRNLLQHSECATRFGQAILNWSGHLSKVD